MALSSDPVSQFSSKESSGLISPAVHLEFIQNQVGLPEEAGIEEIQSYHKAVFLHHHAQDLERFQQLARVHGDRVAHLESRLTEIRSKLAGMDRLNTVRMDGELDASPGSPWNPWDASMFVAALLGIVTLLVFGVLNISFNLLESGLVTFTDNPIRAYLWAALLPVGALGVKVGWDSIQDRRLRDKYQWSCLAAGLAGVVVWVASYAVIYPTLSKTTKDHIESLSVFDDRAGGNAVTASGAKWLDTVIVAAQATAEVFLSAVLGIYMTLIYARHRPVRFAGNPFFTQLDEERHSLESSVASERIALADAEGSQSRLQNQLSALLAFAKSMYQKEVDLRRDQSQQKRALLDQISDQLRAQLQSVENGDPQSRNQLSRSTIVGESTHR